MYLAALSMVATLVFASVVLAQDSSSVQDSDHCPASTRAVGDASGFTGCVPLEELCDADTLTASQYAECIGAPENITAGGGEGILMVIDGTASELPNTGGPSILLPISVLLLGFGIVGLIVIRQRTP